MRVTRLKTVLMVAILAAMFACGGRGSPEELVRRGDEHLQAGRLSEAIVEYQNAVKADDRSGIARHKLGLAYAKAGEPQAALDQLVRAADLLPNDAQAQLDAATSLLLAGRFEDAGGRAAAVLKADTRNVRAHVIRASATANLRDLEGAMTSIEEAIKIDPTRSSTYIHLATLQAASGRLEEAEAGLRQAITLAPEKAGARLTLANLYWQSGRRAEAEETLKQALSVEPNNARANYSLAALYLTTGRRREAEAPLRRIAEVAKDPTHRLRLADYYVAEKRLEDAKKILVDLSTIEGAKAAAKVRLAAIEYEGGRRQEAYSLVDALLKEQPNNVEVLLVKAGWLLGEKKFDAAIQVAETATRADPRSAPALSMVGSLLMRMNRTDDAVKAFTTVLQLNSRDVDAKVALAELNLGLQKPDAALQFAEDAVKSQPLHGAARMVLVRALLASGKVDRAETEMRPVLDAAPNMAVVQALGAEIQRRRGNAAGAKKGFERAAVLDKNSVDAVAGLVNVALGEKKPSEASKALEKRLAEDPDNPQLQLLAGQTYAATGDLVKAEASFKRAIQLAPSLMEAYNKLGQIYVRQNRLTEAKQAYDDRLKQRPDDISAHTMVGMISIVEGKMPEARARFEKILQIDPNAAVAANNLAYLDAEAGTNLDLALSRAQIAKAALPDDPEVNDTLGWVYYKRDLASMAVPPLELAARLAPGNPVTRYHLGMTYLKMGDKAKARESLEQALKLKLVGNEAAEAKKALAALGK